MTAPTLAAIVESVAKALADDWNSDRDPVLTAMFRDYANTAVTATLQALQPFVDECLNYARMNDEVGDRRDADGNHAAAQRAYGSRDAHNAVANQLRALMPATTGEKS